MILVYLNEEKSFIGIRIGSSNFGYQNNLFTIGTFRRIHNLHLKRKISLKCLQIVGQIQVLFVLISNVLISNHKLYRFDFRK